MHLAHQALALLEQRLFALGGAQPLVGFAQLLFLRGQALGLHGIGQLGRAQRALVAREGHPQEHGEHAHVGIGGEVNVLDADEIPLHRQVMERHRKRQRHGAAQ
ncbi:hypothetical protein D3C71_1841570 [compost metagenome]